jgi:dTDP-4-amino-4,6-dideoxygalactose transaminase
MDKLAIHGGPQVRTQPFPAWPVFDDREEEKLVKVLRSGKWWRYAYGQGVELTEKESGEDRAEVVKFQEAFARTQQAKYAIAGANGTGTLEISLKALGIGPGDEVIVPPYTFIASASAVLQVCAVPIFVDIDPDTYNIDVTKIEAAVTPRTRAIMVVHFAGQPAPMDEILQIARKHNLVVVEDAAHAHGSSYKGRRVGAIGNVGSFSFQSSKNMTSGEGGILTTNDKDLARMCDSLLWAGREVGRPWYEFHRLGWNYRLTEFQAAILSVQLTRLEEQNATRRKNAEYLTRKLSQINGITPCKVLASTTEHSYHIYMFKFNPEGFKGKSRQEFLAALNAEGIPGFSGYTFPLYKNPMFLNKEFYKGGFPAIAPYARDINYTDFEKTCPVAEKACNAEAVWLEHRLFLGTQSDMDDIAEAVVKVNKLL